MIFVNLFTWHSHKQPRDPYPKYNLKYAKMDTKLSSKNIWRVVIRDLLSKQEYIKKSFLEFFDLISVNTVVSFLEDRS